MKLAAWLLISLTIWVDLNLLLGVIFTGHYGRAAVLAEIRMPGFSVDSTTSGGVASILAFVLGTGALAIMGIRAQLRAPRENLGLKS